MTWLGTGLSIAFAFAAWAAAADTRRTLREIRDELRRRPD
jgi:hypothetical protein